MKVNKNIFQLLHCVTGMCLSDFCEFSKWLMFANNIIILFAKYPADFENMNHNLGHNG